MIPKYGTKAWRREQADIEKHRQQAKEARAVARDEQVSTLINLLRDAHIGQPLATQDIGILRLELSGMKQMIARLEGAVCAIHGAVELTLKKVREEQAPIFPAVPKFAKRRHK